MFLQLRHIFLAKLRFCFFVLLFFCYRMKKSLSYVTTGSNVLSFEVINDCNSNVFNDFSAYLTVFNTLEPVVLKI